MASSQNAPSKSLYIFISYAREQEEVAEEIANVLKKSKIRIFWDVENISSGDNWDMTIEQALHETTHMILLLSKDSMPDRKEVHREWFLFDQDKKPIIPILLENCELHSRLRAYNYIDARQDLEFAIKKIFDTLNLSYPDNPATDTTMTANNSEDESLMPAPGNLDSQKKQREREGILYWLTIAGFIVAILSLIVAIIQIFPPGSPPQATQITAISTGTEELEDTPPIIEPNSTNTSTLSVSDTETSQPTNTNTPISEPPDGVFRLIDENMVLITTGSYAVHTDNTIQNINLSIYAIDRYEVSREQFRHYLNNSGVSLSIAAFERLSDTADNSDLPMTNVGYNEALDYCEWLGKTLPTSEQWEIAASWNYDENRIMMYPWGDDENYAGYANIADERDTFLPVDSFLENFMGIHHIAGNASEWVLSIREGSYLTRGGHYRAALADVQIGVDMMEYDRVAPDVSIQNIGLRCAQNA